MQPFVYERRVSFADTDMAGLAHFTSMLRWVEEAEAAYWREQGGQLAERTPTGVVGWPKVALTVDFRAPVAFEEVVLVELSEVESGKRSKLWRFVLRRQGSGDLVAEGTMRVVRAKIATDGAITPEPIGAT